MKITREQLRRMISEVVGKDPEEEKLSKAAIEGSPAAVKYDDWMLDLMRILNIGVPDNIPDITTYDAHQSNMTPARYAEIIGEPQESEQEKTQRLEKQTASDAEGMDDEFEAFLQAVESGDVIDLDDRR